MQRLLGILPELFELDAGEAFSPDAPLADYGLDPLCAIELHKLIKRAFSVTFPIESLSNSPTTSSLAKMIAETLSCGRALLRPGGQRASNDREVPLSFAQRRVWDVLEADPDSGRVNLSAAYRIKGHFNTRFLQESLNAIVRRHATLRSVILTHEDHTPYTIQIDRRPTLEIVRLDHAVAPENNKVLAAQLRAARDRPFQFSKELPMRAMLYIADVGEIVLLFVSHRIIFDAQSTRRFIEEFFETYAAKCLNRAPNLPEIPFQYDEYSAWEQSYASEMNDDWHLAYWREQLKDIVFEATVPAPRVPDNEPLAVYAAIGRDTMHSVDEFCKRERCTRLPVFLSVLHKLWLDIANSTEPVSVIGYDLPNREFAGSEYVLGLFDNTFISCVGSKDVTSVGDLFQSIKRDVFQSYEHRRFGLQWAGPQLLSKSQRKRSPLFPVRLTFVDIFPMSIKLPDCNLSLIEVYDGNVPFAMEVVVMKEARRSSLQISVNRRNFTLEQVSAIPSRIFTLLRELCV